VHDHTAEIGNPRVGLPHRRRPLLKLTSQRNDKKISRIGCHVGHPLVRSAVPPMNVRLEDFMT
jgi:hypothetical protein